jgi:hypothetical protein
MRTRRLSITTGSLFRSPRLVNRRAVMRTQLTRFAWAVPSALDYREARELFWSRTGRELETSFQDWVLAQFHPTMAGVLLRWFI